MAESSKTVTTKPAAKGEESKTETQKIATEESKNVPTPAIEEELKEKLTITEGKQRESKNAATKKGEEKEEGTKVKLKTLDGVAFEVEQWMAKEMETVQAFIDNADASADAVVVPLHNVTSDELARIVEYCREHRVVAREGSETAVRKFEERFTEPMSLDDLKELVMAANYLDIKTLLECLTTQIADRIKNKSVEFVRDFFEITNDYTPEEEAEYRQSVTWAFKDIDWAYKESPEFTENMQRT